MCHSAVAVAVMGLGVGYEFGFGPENGFGRGLCAWVMRVGYARGLCAWVMGLAADLGPGYGYGFWRGLHVSSPLPGPNPNS